MDSPPTTEGARRHRLLGWFRSRIGRRVVALYLVSALLPLSLCTLLLANRFGDELRQSQQHNLDGLVRSFGMTLLARLGSADDVLKSITAADGSSDRVAEDQVMGLPWVRSVRRVQAAPPPGTREDTLDEPTPEQRRALSEHHGVLRWDTDASGNARVLLVRTLPSGAWLYTEIEPAWLWASAAEFAGGATLVVLDEAGHVLTAEGELPAALRPAPRLAQLARAGAAGTASAAPFMARSWELFLRSAFHTASWHLLALRPAPTLLRGEGERYLYLFAIILGTALLIAWLSVITIRRQLQPLAELARAARRVAHKDFAAFEGMHWNDEFGDLARSFGAMSRRLKTQFSALETLAEVDRLLLEASALEPILDTLLPRVANVLRCECVSVLLFDPDSDDHVRGYDYWHGLTEPAPVRRIATDAVQLKRLCQQQAALHGALATAAPLRPLLPATPQPVRSVGLHALKHDERVGGVLCIGYAGEPARSDPGATAQDFADRLSLILVNLEQAESLRRQAHFDALTGLQNRQLFAASVCAAVAAAQACQGRGGLLYLDLDHFKHVNDTAGHGAGDELLRIVGQRLAACAQPGQAIARLGGDEFAVLLPRIAQPDDLRLAAERLIAALERPVVVSGREHHVSASIGMSVFPSDGTRFEELLKSSDIAMYQAKDAGRGRAVFFETAMQHKLLERLALESGMHQALRAQEFRVFYQPIVCRKAGGMVGVEALARWPRPGEGGWVSPQVFIPIAEENSLIVALGEWVLRCACQQFARWREAGLSLSYVSVNVSVRQLREADFTARLLAIVRESGMQPAQLRIEITEGVLAKGGEVEHNLTSMAAHGVCLALDDFGTGYSSLSYLRSYPIHTVKIDRSFVQCLPDDPAACRLTESIVMMCAALGKEVVAEGVESEAQQRFLERVGCEVVQGYLFGRPMEAADIPGFAHRLQGAATPQAAPASAAAAG